MPMRTKDVAHGKIRSRLTPKVRMADTRTGILIQSIPNPVDLTYINAPWGRVSENPVAFGVRVARKRAGNEPMEAT